MKTMFLASASPDAPVLFNQRMRILQEHLAEMRPFAPDPLSADLVIAVVDVLSLPLMDVIRMRCEAKRHLRVFCHIHIVSDLDRMVTDCISNARARGFRTIGVNVDSATIVDAYATLPDPIEYWEDHDIMDNIGSLLIRSVRPREVVRDAC